MKNLLVTSSVMLVGEFKMDHIGMQIPHICKIYSLHIGSVIMYTADLVTRIQMEEIFT